MTKVKTSELIATALDWAVAKCEGLKPYTMPGKPHAYLGDGCHNQIPRYSTNWVQGGPIVERGLIEVSLFKADGSAWFAQSDASIQCGAWITGPTILIAAMRCYVASKLGVEIEIPEELLS